MNRFTANFLLLLGGLVWGFGFVAQATAMENIGPFQFLASRFLLATVVMLPFCWWEWQRLKTSSDAVFPFSQTFRASILVGIIFFVMMALQQVGILGTSVTNAGMLTGLYVILTPILMVVFWSERAKTHVWIASAIALLGIWFLGGGGLDKFTWGDGLIIICAIFSALQVIAISLAVEKAKLPVAVATTQFAVCGVFGLIGFVVARMANWSLEPEFSTITFFAAAPEVLYASVVAGAFAFTLQAIAQRYTTASAAAVLLASEAVFAAIGGALVLDERLDFLGYAGCLLLFSAIVLVSYLSSQSQN